MLTFREEENAEETDGAQVAQDHPERTPVKRTGTESAKAPPDADATLSVLDGPMKSHIRDTFLKRSR
jgi:hypothetical protein